MLNEQLRAGLTQSEAKQRLAVDGFNELPSSKGRSIFATAADIATEPMFILLFACGTIYLLLGDIHEALMLLGFVFVVAGITLYQQRKAERALDALRDLSSPRALVIRDGKRVRIPGREVVKGDLLVLAEGDRIPADAVVISCEHLTADESLLTGESVAVSKLPWDEKRQLERPGGEDLPFVFSGTLVTQGLGIARVLATGNATEMGKIGSALQSVRVEGTALQLEITRLIRNVAILGILLGLSWRYYLGLTRGSWLNAFLAGITAAMGLLPEEFPVVLTIYLALGAWRLSKQRVLTRSVPAIETLGSATVLCVDKTGTLTMNRMSISRLIVDGHAFDLSDNELKSLPDEAHRVIEFGILASQRDPFDPMEKAFHELGNTQLADTEHLHNDWTLERGYPLSSTLLAMSHVWKSPSGRDYVLAAKGAPEAIAELCHLSEIRTKQIAEQIGVMAQDGLRVLGIARGVYSEQTLPGEQHDFTFEFLGLCGLADPVRSTVPNAVAECYAAGMRVVMITGDHRRTAQSIAEQIGLNSANDVITGTELDELNDAELRKRISTVNVFARMIPEQKLMLVNALKANGEIVAMTGDGVNDAPALKLPTSASQWEDADRRCSRSGIARTAR